MEKNISMFHVCEKESVRIEIRLADECKNWHNDFSITWDDYINQSWWRIHKRILELYPEFKIFADLHLSDEYWIPMNAGANLSYHIKTDKEIAKKYNFIGDKEIEILENYVEDQEAFEYILDNLWIIKKWNDLAKKGIAKLEGLTWKKYKYMNQTSKHLKWFDKKAIEKKINGWYFEKENVEFRKKVEIENKINAEMERKIQKLETEIKDVKFNLEISEIIRKKYFELTWSEDLFDNFIFYTHNQKLVFNWKLYGAGIKKEHFEIIKKELENKLNYLWYIDISMK